MPETDEVREFGTTKKVKVGGGGGKGKTEFFLRVASLHFPEENLTPTYPEGQKGNLGSIQVLALTPSFATPVAENSQVMFLG